MIDNKKPSLDLWYSLMAFAILLVGVFIRVKILIQNRSLFIDEASLARNLCEKNYVDFFSPLSYEQYAPPLFMVESKVLVQLLGNYEWAMRLIPFFAGLGSLWIFWLLLKEWVASPVVRLYGLSLICFSFLSIRYATEFKQYSGDAFLCLAFVWLAWKDRATTWNWRKCIVWAIMGGIGIWYSMPLVFTLSGVGLFFLWEHKRSWLRICGVIMIWLLSFSIYYSLILQNDIGSDYLESYFQHYFLDVLSLSPKVWTNNLRLFSDLFRNVTDKTAISIGFGIISFIVGTYHLVTHKRSDAILLLVPFLTFLGACIFHYYNLMSRLTVFILPILTLIICIGLDRIWSTCNQWVKAILLLLMVLGIINKKGLDYLGKDMTFEEIKPCLEVLSQSIEPSDLLIVDHEAKPAFEFYRRDYAEKFEFPSEILIGSWDTDISSIIDSRAEEAIWILYSHRADESIGTSVDQYRTKNPRTLCSSERVLLLKVF